MQKEKLCQAAFSRKDRSLTLNPRASDCREELTRPAGAVRSGGEQSGDWTAPNLSTLPMLSKPGPLRRRAPRMLACLHSNSESTPCGIQHASGPGHPTLRPKWGPRNSSTNSTLTGTGRIRLRTNSPAAPVSLNQTPSKVSLLDQTYLPKGMP